ncbi:MAG: hypothetical protein KDK55_03600 [Chlamydiia bacterium]|nr:hypothetical protein [Chlamydiia bacterium]
MIEAPNSQETEMMVLGCMLTGEEALHIAAQSLEEQNFYSDVHKTIFGVLKKAHHQNKPADVHLVCEELKRLDKLDKVGGPAYVVELAQYAGTSAYIEEYIDQLIDQTTRRNLYEIAANSSLKSTEEIRNSIVKKFDEAIRKKKSIDSLYRHLLDPTSEQEIIDEVRNTSPGIRVGMSIGNIDLELPGGAITITAGPTSHGKTTLLINLAIGVLNQNPNKSVYFFTYEESKASIVSLFLNTYVGKEISNNNRRSIESFFRNGNCKHIKEDSIQLFINDKRSFFTSLIDSGRLNIHYSEMTAEQLCQAIKYLQKNREDIGAVFIDYMQLLNLLDSGRLSRQEQLKHVCLMLKDCSVETGLPIVLGAQFNRQVTCEADLSPIYISEAGDIERIASLILGFWNRNFLGFSREGNKTKNGNTITEPRQEIYIEVLKGRKIGNGHSCILSFKGNEGKIDNTLANSISPKYCTPNPEKSLGRITK